MARARYLAIATVNNYPVTRVREDAPASSEAARDRYIRKASEADFVIWLVGSTTTKAVVEEVEACRGAGGKLLAFTLPARRRDPLTRELIKRVQEDVTWRQVRDVETLPRHIKEALNGEVLRAVRDPAPLSHDTYLKRQHRLSLAETRRLWITLGVRDDVAPPDDVSIGHKLPLPTTGVLQVIATQGSGKTLAAYRLYQHAIENRLNDRLEPLPVFLNAPTIVGEPADYIEKAVAEQGSTSTQRVLVIIDSLDETGRYAANEILNRVASYVDANQNVAAVVMTRSLPGLKRLDGSIGLPTCGDEEFLSIASRVAGRQVKAGEVPYQVSRTRLPLFAVVVGTHLRDSRRPVEPSPSLMIGQLVQRILEESSVYPEEMAEPLKKLAIACINSGESVNKVMIDPRPSVQGQLADSRVVIEENHRYDFALAIFREFFAARALVEKMISPADIDLTSDRWVVPLAIATNLDAILGRQIMEAIAARDPGIAGLLLEEVKHSWSMEDSSEDLPAGTAIELGCYLRQAMSNWKEGLGPLFAAVGPMSQDGGMLALAIHKDPHMVTTRWYQGEEHTAPVVVMPPGRDPFSEHGVEDWLLIMRGIQDTPVWPWSTTHEDLSTSLSRLLENHELALGSTIGIREFAAEFADTLGLHPYSAVRAPKLAELTNWIDEWLDEPGRGPRDSIMFGIGNHSYTFKELKLIRATLPELPRNHDDTLAELWPDKDKPRPTGRRAVWWYELYTEERLLERANAIFNGALRIYNDIVARWFAAFNKRHQLSYVEPLALDGVLTLTTTPGRRALGDAGLICLG